MIEPHCANPTPMQPITEPEIAREVSFMAMAGRRFSPAVLAFVRAIRDYDWAGGPND